MGDRWEAIAERVQKWTEFTRAKAVVAGVLLLAVPTIFGLFPSWTDWNKYVRGAILGVWLLIAIGAVASSFDINDSIRKLSTARRRELRQLRLRALKSILTSLLHPERHGFPGHYTDFTVYLYESRGKLLVPWYPKLEFWDDPDPRIFAPGKGATGTAWDRKEIVVVHGAEVSNRRYLLSQEQQQYFSRFNTVASVPIWKRGTDMVGVLTLLSEQDDPYFDQAGGQNGLQALADTLGVVLASIPEPGDLE